MAQKKEPRREAGARSENSLLLVAILPNGVVGNLK